MQSFQNSSQFSQTLIEALTQRDQRAPRSRLHQRLIKKGLTTPRITSIKRKMFRKSGTQTEQQTQARKFLRWQHSQITFLGNTTSSVHSTFSSLNNSLIPSQTLHKKRGGKQPKQRSM